MYESPTITANDLFSNVGGQLVLFMGISIFSFLEILELLFNLFWVAFNSKVSKIDIYISRNNVNLLTEF